MLKNGLSAGIDGWLGEVRSHFAEAAPDLLPLFEIYAAEARFGRRYLDADLQHLPAAARVLEVGAGALLLSCQLSREGYVVTALEPTSDGFSHFTRMRQIVLDNARAEGCCPQLLEVAAERMSERNAFDFAFSINVMEHVDNVSLVLERLAASLACGGTYRFTCPNYLFPYEPHFNIPTVFSKSLTERVFGRRIFSNQTVADPVGTWKSLNWITVTEVRRLVERLPELQLSFNRGLLVSTLERMLSDQDFASRRSPFFRKLLSFLVRFRVHRIFRFLPATMQPIMDCRIVKVAGGGAS
ncbi:methyltransferase domain-containing protein [Candidatus Accumulibacter sp. ACC003]|uniref:class I SAM-dependent methyltransferase n=1 Tax=Candidatus Accumulibacter sp. ACC003 TaxID=2823334 RepID=UPI0025C0BBE3|nr:methyltransferase domain-containing protein [Candidatus Accumulibacter sp. ACC003]